MDIKPNRPVRVGTKMLRTGDAGDITLPSPEQYAAELQGLTDNARLVDAGELRPDEVRASAPVEQPAMKAAAKKPQSPA